MIKIFGMSTCPTCTFVKEQVKGNDKYEVINLEDHARNLKAFLKLRDNDPAFEETRRTGAIGIPCFVLEDGTVTLKPEDAGLLSEPVSEGSACNIDGTGC